MCEILQYISFIFHTQKYQPQWHLNSFILFHILFLLRALFTYHLYPDTGNIYLFPKSWQKNLKMCIVSNS